MTCSIVNSIMIVMPTWRPYIKKKDFDPYIRQIKIFEELSTSVRILSEIYPPYASGWIRVELEIEKYFEGRLEKWNESIKAGDRITYDKVIEEIKSNRKYLKNSYEMLLKNNIRIKKLLKHKLTQYIQIENYAVSLGLLDAGL